MFRYALATGLHGFPTSTLRVIVSEIRDGYAWVVTADLLDAGTHLVLDASQISPLPDGSGEALVHKSALV